MAKDLSTTNYLIRLPEVSSRTGLPTSSIYALIAEGGFPSPVKIGARSSAWVSAEVMDWIEQRISNRDNS